MGSAGITNQFLFNSQEFDGAVLGGSEGLLNHTPGLESAYYLRARFYQPANGRFVSQDPIIGSDYAPETLHRYLYTGNDPICRVDPSGKSFMGVVGALVAITSMMNSRITYDSAAMASRTFAITRIAGPSVSLMTQSAVTGAMAQSAIAPALQATIATAGPQAVGSATIAWTIGITAALMATTATVPLGDANLPPTQPGTTRRNYRVYMLESHGIPQYGRITDFFPETAQHIIESIYGGGIPSLGIGESRNERQQQALYYDNNPAAKEMRRRDALQIGISREMGVSQIPTRRDMERDEYPFASVVQAGSWSNVRYVPTADNQNGGRDWTAFLNRFQLQPSWIWVCPFLGPGI